MQLNRYLIKYVLLGLAMFSFSQMSMAAEPNQTQVNMVKQAFSKNFPNIKIQSIKSTPIANIYQIITNFPAKEVVYITNDANYLITGEIIDIKSRKNLTEAQRRILNRVDTSKFPLQNAIKEVRGNGSRKLIVFSDPDCPFCRMLENELPKLNNVTIYTFLFPIAELHPNAEHDSLKIWCSKNILKTWNDYMRNGKKLTGSENCNNPIKENLALGGKLGFSGTPTMIFPNGDIAPGALKAKQIDRMLNDK